MPAKGANLRVGILAAVLAVVLFGFRAMIFNHLPGVFTAPEEDMDYAWFVPLFSLAVLWTERRLLSGSLGAPSFWGVLAAVPCLALGLLGTRGLQVRFELLAFIGLIVAVPYAIFGRECAKRVAFPAACLLFCMPLASYLSIFTVHLRLLASAVAGGILSVFFDGVVREGNLIGLSDVIIDGSPFVIDIASPCSGLRSIFALMAISVGYGYFTQPTWTRRAILLVLSLPIAILGNIVRIMSICIVAKSADPAFALGFYHDFSGFVVFAVALLLMVAAGGVLDRVFGAAANSETPEPPSAVAASPARGAAAFLPVALVALLVVPVMVYQSMSPEPALTEPPKLVFPSIDGFTVEQLPLSEAEEKQLVGATVEKRIYKAGGNGFWFMATSVTSGASKSSMHRPELCLPSQGFDMGESHTLDAAGISWRVIPLTPKGDRQGALFAYTFANQDGYRTDSHEARIWRDVWDRSVHNRIDRWVMVTVQVPTSDENVLRAVLGEMKGVVEW